MCSDRCHSSLSSLLLGCVLLFTTLGLPAADAECQFSLETAPVSGGRIHYGRVGEGPPVLLLHGLFAEKEQWLGLACRLADSGYTAIAPDLPGFGRSLGFPMQVYALANQSARLDEFANALGLREFALAGNSMGGAIAAIYAQAHPSRVRSLALLGAPLGVVGWSSEMRAAIESGINPFIPQNDRELDLELALLFVRPPELPEALRKALVREYRQNYRHYVAVWNIVSLDSAILQSIERFAVSTRVFWGSEDRVFSIRGAHRLRSRLPADGFVALDGMGHLPQVESPDRVASAYLPFLAHTLFVQTAD